MASRGGPRVGAGRPRGALGKRTYEQLAIAARTIDAAQRGDIELAKDVLDRLMKLAEGAAGVNRPTTQADLAAGRAANPDGDWERFGAWFDRTAYCAKELAKYQSPTYKAIAVQAMPEIPNRPPPKQIEGQVIDMNDPKVQQQIYLRMIKGSKT